MPKAPTKTTVKPVVSPAKPDKDQLLNEAKELIVSLRRQCQEANDAATSGWLNRYHETRKDAQ